MERDRFFRSVKSKLNYLLRVTLVVKKKIVRALSRDSRLEPIVISNSLLRNLSICSSSTQWRCPHQRACTAIRC